MVTIGKTYYLACVFERINWLSGTFAVMLTMVTIALLCIFGELKFEEAKHMADHQQVVAIQKYTKISTTLLAISLLLNIFVPSRNDFLIAAMTKDYRPEQIYKMTKEELKSGVDYIVNSIEKVKNETN